MSEYILLAFMVIGVFILVTLLSSKITGRVSNEPSYEPKARTATETLAELKAQEQLEKEYKLVSYWVLNGKKITNPTDEQMSSPYLAYIEKWVKK